MVSKICLILIQALIPCSLSSSSEIAFLVNQFRKNDIHRGSISNTFGTPSLPFVSGPSSFPRKMADWSDFAYDDEDEVLDVDFADENDSQELKAQVGMGLEAPVIFSDAAAIMVPQGSVLPLTVDNVEGVLQACRDEIGTMFGYSAENRGVGITGGVDFVEMDGPMVVLSLKGRFWHERTTVLARVGAYIMGRIPEVIDVVIDDPETLTLEANEAAM